MLFWSRSGFHRESGTFEVPESLKLPQILVSPGQIRIVCDWLCASISWRDRGGRWGVCGICGGAGDWAESLLGDNGSYCTRFDILTFLNINYFFQKISVLFFLHAVSCSKNATATHSAKWLKLFSRTCACCCEQDGALFSWTQERSILENGPFEFRHRSTPALGAKALIASEWRELLEETPEK